MVNEPEIRMLLGERAAQADGEPADAAPIIRAALRLQRRRRATGMAVTGAAIAACLVTGVALAGSGDEASLRPAATPSPQRSDTVVTDQTQLSGVVRLYKPDGETWQLCVGPGFGGGCQAELPLAGMAPNEPPGTMRERAGLLSGPVRVTGRYTGGTFVLSTQPESAQANDDFPAPMLKCPAPDGGWSEQPMTSEQQEQVMDYVRAHERVYGGGWFTDGQRVQTVTFTRDVEAARQALAGLRRHVCVLSAPHTLRSLLQASNNLQLTTAERRALTIAGGGVDEVASKVVVRVVVATKTVKAELRRRVPADMLDIQPYLIPTG